MSQEAQKEESFIIKYKKEILGGLITLLAFTFIFLNYQQVDFWFFGTMRVRLIILLVAFYGLGFLTHYIFSYFKKKELKNKVKELEKSSGKKETDKTITALEEKINKLEKALEAKNTPPTTPPPAV